MSKKKPPNPEPFVATAESIEHFSRELADYSERLKSVVTEMRKNGFPSIDRSSKRNQQIIKAIGQYTRGLEGALERMQDDIDATTTTQLRVAETTEPFESVQKKADKK